MKDGRREKRRVKVRKWEGAKVGRCEEMGDGREEKNRYNLRGDI